MKKTMTVRVTFRDEDDKLTCLMTDKFRSVEEAKAAIEADAGAFIDAHDHPSKAWGPLRVIAHWYDTKNTDYYRVRAKDNAQCIWQYFVEQ